MTAKKPALYVQFLFCFFSRFPHRCDCTELASCVTMQNNSCSAMISSHDEETHNLTEKAKGATKSTTAGIFEEAHTNSNTLEVELIKLRANGHRNAGSCCVRLHRAKSLTGFKLCAATPNNIQQHATGCANGRNM